MSVLGWVVFALAVGYVYALPNFMYPEAFAMVDGKVEALLLGLCVLYLYGYEAKSFPWMILLVLAFSEFQKRPVVGAIMTGLSLVLNLSPDRWWNRDFDIDLDDLDDEFSDLEDF